MVCEMNFFSWHAYEFSTPNDPRNDHHPHKRPPTLKFNISATMGDIEAALAALSLPESLNYAQTSREFGVDRTTLTRRFKGKHVSRQDARFHSQSLRTKQEKDLVSYINRLAGRGLPPTIPMVRNFAFEMSKTMPEKNWVYKFVQRHTTP